MERGEIGQDEQSSSDDRMEKPLVSVIIPTYNRVELLEKTVRSVREQSYPNVEIIVVDDGSSDGTKEQFEDVSDVLLCTQKNQGPSVARNLGMCHANGEFLAFLDSDDYWEPGFLTACVGRLLATNAGMAFANWNEVDDSGSVLNPDMLGRREYLNSLNLSCSDGWESLTSDQTRDLFVWKTLAPPSGVVVRRSLFSHEWVPHVSIGEDRLFVLEGVFNNPVSAEFTRQILWSYRIHDSNSCTNNPDLVRVSRGEIEAQHELMKRLGDRLTPDQSAFSKASLAASYHDLGYHLSRAGERREAMNAYRASWKIRPSFPAAMGMLKNWLRKPQG